VFGCPLERIILRFDADTCRPLSSATGIRPRFSHVSASSVQVKIVTDCKTGCDTSARGSKADRRCVSGESPNYDARDGRWRDGSVMVG